MKSFILNIDLNKSVKHLKYHPEIAATAIKSVDRTTVNYEQSFTYTINASFSGLGDFGAILDAKITDFIPNDIEIIRLPPKGGIIKDIITNYIPGVGTYITFEFGAIIDTGVAYVFELECKYKPSAENNTSFINHIDMTVTQATQITNISANAPSVNLVAISNFTLNKVKRLPIINPGPGSRLVYVINFDNIGDKGACVENVVISDLLPNGVTIDPAFPPIGKDISKLPFQDTKYDKTLDPPFSNQIDFDLSGLGPYCGTNYQITITVLVDPTIIIDPLNPIQLENTVNWSINGEVKTPYILNTNLTDPIYASSISKDAPTYLTKLPPENKISYSLYFQNSGNQDLTNVTVIDSLPMAVIANRLYTGVYGISSINYTLIGTVILEYSTDNKGTWNSLGTYNPGIGQWIPLPTSPRITNIRWTFSDWTSGVTSLARARIDGTVDPTTSDSYIENIAEIVWNEGPGPYVDSDTKTTTLNGNSVLSLSKSRVGTNSAVIPGNIIKYRLSFNSNKSTIENAILSDLLPAQLEYVSPLGIVNSTYYNYFSGSNQLLSYSVTVTPNYNSTGRTLVSFNIITPSIFEQNSSISIDFNAIVKVGATGVISNQGTLNSDNNPNPSNPALSNTVNTNISFNNSIASDKKVKGALDTDYTEFPYKGKTYNGGTLEYKLTLSNTGNLNLEQLEVVDILPHIGDTGVILTDNPRGSQFEVYLTNIPHISISSTDPSLPKPTVVVQYSNSYDPVRFGPTNNIIGTVNDWTTVMPYPSNLVKSIKISIKDTSLKPGQSIIVTIEAQVPVGLASTIPPLVAWNSFALKGSYKNQFGNLTSFLPVEPEKVGITVEQPIYDGKIGDFTWHDNYEIGVYNPSVDVGLNNVTVYLYDVDPTIDIDATPIAVAITNNNSLGQPGYYLFSNLPTNKTYYLKFIPPLGFEYTVQNLGPNGSRPDPNNGVVKNITLTDSNPEVLDVDAGFIDRICETNHIEQCLYLLETSNKIEYIDTNQTFLYVSISKSYLDKSIIIYKEYFGNIVPGHNLYISSDIEYHLHYNANDFQLYNMSYETVLFVPEYVQENLISAVSSISNANFFICGCRKAFFITLDLKVCINFQ